MEFDQVMHAVWRAVDLYNYPDFRMECVARAMELDFSWEASAKKYMDIYNEIW